MKPIVSVISPYYNEPLWMLKRNVNSILNQITGYSIEHIIVIDNPDVSGEILEYLTDLEKTSDKSYTLKFYTHEKNKGLSAARNTALKNSTGKYIMLLDTDDSFEVCKVQMQVDFMIKRNLDHCYGGYQEIHGNSKTANEAIIMPPSFDIEYLVDFNNLCFCGSNCFTREVYNCIGGFDEDMKEGAEDLEYWIRIAYNGFESEVLPHVLYFLGVHDSNMTAKLVDNGGFIRAYEYIRNKYPNLNFTK